VLLEWLGLAQPSDSSAESTNQLVASLYLALYDPATKQATLIEDARSENAASNDEVLFHELVHAQQDARYDLASILAGVNSVDSLIGRRSLVEGEALFHQILFDFGALDMPLTATNLQRAMEGLRSSEEASWMADPATAWTRSLVLASYVYGQFLVRDWWLQGGPEGMVARFADPPTESLRMLEAAFAREPTTDRIWAYPAASIFAPAGQALPVPGNEQYPLAVDRLGAWTLYVLASLAGEDDVARALGTGWRGDELDLFQLQDGGFAGRLRVSVDTVDNANELARLLSAKLNVEVRTNGTFVVAALTAQPAKPDWLFGPLEAP